MALTPTQQAQELISRANRILVTTRTNPTTDTIASAVACGLFLKKRGATCDVVVPGFDAKKAPPFLMGADEIQSAPGGMRTLELEVDVSEIPLGELMYDVKNGKLCITCVPKEKEWTPKHVDVKHGSDRYDLIIALDCPDMMSLGAIAKDYPDFLHRTTIVNADHAPENEHWGQVNLVNLNAVSTTECLYELFSEWDKDVIDEHIATALLAGMIAKTRSFRTQNVTPKTLATSSALVAQGARREEIVNGLWRTRDIATLRLWGRALSRLQHEKDCGLVWTVLGHKDFLESGAAQDGLELEAVIDELISYAPDAGITALIYESPEKEGGICVTIATQHPHHAHELGRRIGAIGTRDRATTCLRDTSLTDAVNQTIQSIKQSISSR